MTAKRREILERIRFANETYGIGGRPCVLSLLALYNAYHRSVYANWREQKADDPRYVKDLELYAKPFMKAMEDTLDLLVVAVNAKAVELVGHGGSPDCDDDTKNDAAWRQTLPGKGKPIAACVSLPKDSYPYHPVLKASLDCDLKPAVTIARDTRDKAMKAQDNGLLPVTKRQEIMSPVRQLASPNDN